MLSAKTWRITLAFILVTTSVWAQDTVMTMRAPKDPLEPATVKPQVGGRFSLRECVRRALENNRKIKAAGYGISAAEAQVRESHALGKPVIQYEYGTAPAPRDATRAVQTFFTGDWIWANRLKFELGMPLYTFGKLSTVGMLAQKGVEAAENRQVSEEVQVVSKVRQTYYGIQFADELTALLQDTVSRLNAELAKSESDNASENHSPLDKLRMKVFKADLEKRLAEVTMRRELALAVLKVQMGLPDDASIRPSSGLAPVSNGLASYEEYVSRFELERPESRLVDIGVESKRLEYMLSKKQWMPELGMGAFFEMGRTVGRTVLNVGTSDQYLNPFEFTRAGVGLRLQGKLDFNSFLAKSSKAENEYYKASLERDMAKRGMGLEVKEAYLKVKQAKTQMQQSDETRKLARQMVFLSKSNLDLGIGEKSEYVDALQVMLMSKGQYLEAVFNYNSALVLLDEKLGYVPREESTLTE